MLLVLDSFIKKRLMAKSSEFNSDLFNGQASMSHNSISTITNNNTDSKRSLIVITRFVTVDVLRIILYVHHQIGVQCACPLHSKTNVSHRREFLYQRTT